MTVLAIETATAVCAAAIVTNGVLRAEESLEAKNIHAERLLGMIDGTLRRSGLAVSDLEGIAVSLGPGSFTGLRIGLSVAKGLVFGLEIGLAAVPTLEALAWRIADSPAGARAPYILSTIDARRDEVYCQLFTQSEQGPVSSGLPQDLPVDRVKDLLEGKRTIVTGDGAEKVMGSLSGSILWSVAEPALRRCSAETVARLGEHLLRAGQGADPATLEPLYIKEFFLRTTLS
jgi:tRNA threonylcarbamoyladenosine biosynthesis protein TsaB